MNSKLPFIELPIHIMHQDPKEEFIQPLQREQKPDDKFIRKNTITQEQRQFLIEYPAAIKIRSQAPSPSKSGESLSSSPQRSKSDQPKPPEMTLPDDFKPFLMPGSHFSFN